MLSPSTSVVLNRCALINSLIGRAAGFVVANGSAPSIRIMITRPARRSRIGTDRIWVSSSLALGQWRSDIEERAEPCRPELYVDLIGPTSMRSIRAVRKARWRAPGNSGQLFGFTDRLGPEFGEYASQDADAWRERI